MPVFRPIIATLSTLALLIRIPFLRRRVVTFVQICVREAAYVNLECPTQADPMPALYSDGRIEVENFETLYGGDHAYSYESRTGAEAIMTWEAHPNQDVYEIYEQTQRALDLWRDRLFRSLWCVFSPNASTSLSHFL